MVLEEREIESEHTKMGHVTIPAEEQPCFWVRELWRYAHPPPRQGPRLQSSCKQLRDSKTLQSMYALLVHRQVVVEHTGVLCEHINRLSKD